MLHAARQVRFRGLDQRMDMHWHPTIGQHNPSATLHLILKPFGQALVVTRVVEQFSAPVSTRDDVVAGARELNSWGARHNLCAGIWLCLCLKTHEHRTQDLRKRRDKPAWS